LIDALGLEKWSLRLRTGLTKSRLTFFFAAFLLAQSGLFLYLESVPGILDRTERLKGRDFLQYYLAGLLVVCGEADHLYDQRHFAMAQLEIVPPSEFVPPYPSIYPPTTALLFSPFATLPYEQAIVCWWLIQFACFTAAGVLLWWELRPPHGWRIPAFLGYAAFYPMLNTFWNGQLAALLLPLFLAGLHLRRAGWPVAAGLIWSLLALKPQLMVAVGLWLILRREGRALFGIAVGGVVQTTVVFLALGPGVLLAYFFAAREVMGDWYNRYTMAPDHQHAMAGILTTYFGATYRGVATVLHLGLAAVAGWWLLRIRRRLPELEFSAAVPFLLLTIPHLLTYDLVYLLVPVVALLVLSRTRPELLAPAVFLYAAATLAPLYAFLGFSLVPVVLLGVVYLLSRSHEVPCLTPQGTTR